jgi:hypothetical protein
VTVEDSMNVVKASRGRLGRASEELLKIFIPNGPGSRHSQASPRATRG